MSVLYILQIILSCVFLLYLGISAYIDYKTKKVYCYFNYCIWIILIIVGVLFHLFSLRFLLILAFLSLFTWLAEKLHTFGGGDTEVFISIYLFFFIFNNGNIAITLDQICNFFLYLFLFTVVCNVKNIDWKNHMKIKKKIAFIPYIFLSFITILVLALLQGCVL